MGRYIYFCQLDSKLSKWGRVVFVIQTLNDSMSGFISICMCVWHLANSIPLHMVFCCHDTLIPLHMVYCLSWYFNSASYGILFVMILYYLIELQNFHNLIYYVNEQVPGLSQGVPAIASQYRSNRKNAENFINYFNKAVGYCVRKIINLGLRYILFVIIAFIWMDLEQHYIIIGHTKYCHIPHIYA